MVLWPKKQSKPDKVQKELVLKTATDSQVEYAKKIVDTVFFPVLKRNLDTLNEHLAKRGIRAGIDIHWSFDSFEEADES